MTGLIIILVGTGIFFGALGILSRIWQFFRPTRLWLKRKIINAIVESTGISYDAALAMWPVLVFVVIAILVAIVIS